ncbi:3-dehydroquinate dehydratase [Acididesulfobacillus acetoxydans]|uniref:3-dehydroquinate dehydratase n=1 Tax=Acididesulfobacillus acetoxydans TaxID=1561005 RepID=A0A8S0WG52_9FIRM|nr:type I 3-dehydroquinate dehydratase [Acididesulfobacillus acetoxydans]CAA7601602.1 3-dehydroquinate dehydratase [Acididesulfobacillus acetoxydans]CEJ07089.1 3-dehydroquinate dehydratase [Acididesulfobacillus acetoxydans]
MKRIDKQPILKVRGKEFGGKGLPLICTPLVGENREGLERELEKVLPQGPDLVEWRLDFFKNIRDFDQVLQAARTVRLRVGELPLLFTIRSEKEGGHPIPLTSEERVGLYETVCQAGVADLLDFELGEGEENFRRVRETSRRYGVKLMGSFHDFAGTPAPERIMATFRQGERRGADLVKAAVMPQKAEDVLTLLQVTLEGRKSLSIPVITVSMGNYGSLTRMCGWVFGSSLTFAMGEKRSAPGQIPIDELKAVLKVMQKALGGI